MIVTVIGFLLLMALMPNVSQVLPASVITLTAVLSTPILLLTRPRIFQATHMYLLALVGFSVFFTILSSFGSTSTQIVFTSAIRPIAFVYLFAFGVLVSDHIGSGALRRLLIVSSYLLFFSIAVATEFFQREINLYFLGYDPNYLSISLSATLLVGLKLKHKTIFLVSLFFIMLTFSRMGIVVALIIIAQNAQLTWKQYLQLIVALIVSAAIIHSSIFADTIQGIRVPDKFSTYENFLSSLASSSRYELWGDAIDTLVKNPLGVGVGMSPFYLGLDLPIDGELFLSGAPGNLAHNTFLTLLVEQGVFVGLMHIGVILALASVAASGGEVRVWLPIIVLLFFLDLNTQSPFWFFLLIVKFLNSIVDDFKSAPEKNL